MNVSAWGAIDVSRCSLPGRVEGVHYSGTNIGTWGALDISCLSPGRVEGSQEEGNQSHFRDVNTDALTAIGVPRHSSPKRVKDVRYSGTNVRTWGTLNVSCSSPGRVEGSQEEGDRSCFRDVNADALTAIGVPHHSSPKRVEAVRYRSTNVRTLGAINVSRRSSPGNVEGGCEGSDGSYFIDRNTSASTAIGVPCHSLPGRIEDVHYRGTNVGAWRAINVSHDSHRLSPGHVQGGQEGGDQSRIWDANITDFCTTGGAAYSPTGGIRGGVGSDEMRADQAQSLEANSCALSTTGGLVCPTSGGGRDVQESSVTTPLDKGQPTLPSSSVSHTFHEEEESSGEDESLDKGQPTLSSNSESHTFHEEEESSGEDESLSCLDGTQPQVEDVGTDRVLGGTKLQHLAAEEEEESTDNSDSSRLVSAAQHRVAQGSTYEEEDSHPSTASLQSEAETDSNVPEGWGHTGTSAPTPSETPTVLSRHPSEESEVPPNLESTDQVSRLWKDQEALSKALVKLTRKCRDSQLDLTLRTWLTGMKGVLNIYLDPKLNFSWTTASLMVAKIEGHGVKRARKLREWILAFAHSEVLPVHHYDQSRWNVLDDEDVAQTLQTQLLSHTKGHYITASDVVDIVAGPVMQETFLRCGISRTSISERTARRWLQRLSWRYGPMRNGMYIDGHEREDVVAYRNAFVARWKGYEKQFHTWDSNGIEHRPHNDFSVEGGQYEPRFWLILVTHDESVFYQNDSRKTHWIASTSKATPLPKGDGQSIMVSDFLTSEWGRLLDMKPDGVIESVFNSLKAHFLMTIFLLQRGKGHLQTRYPSGWLFHCRKPASAG